MWQRVSMRNWKECTKDVLDAWKNGKDMYYIDNEDLYVIIAKNGFKYEVTEKAWVRIKQYR